LYACNYFARFAQCYTPELFRELLKVLLYLKGTTDWKLIYTIDPALPISITFCCDADYADTHDRDSTYGAIGYVQNNVVYAQASAIRTVMTSSCESESHGIFETCKAAVYITNWWKAFTAVKLPVFVFNDNKAAIAILSVRNNGSGSKHFTSKLRYVTRLVEQNKIRLFHIPRGMNGADILTHSLPRRKFEDGLKLIFGEDALRGLLDVAARSGGDLLMTWRSSMCELVLDYDEW
jgi:hypothetical protein